ncbi:MAG: DUF3531 family protein [Leptolyngbya sp. SIOISBB]|nr:DUF3531 family protein [Leptolyngbya sp. SIOISBB]
MQIQFRECDFFNLWIWIQFAVVPSTMEQQYVDEILNSWFFLGKLGGFNAENLQVQDTGLEISYMHYDDSQADDTLVSLMHNMSAVEYEGIWARCWFDLGTSDALAIDILLNALKQFSADYVAIEQVIIGGENEDWPIPDSYQADVVGSEYN